MAKAMKFTREMLERALAKKIFGWVDTVFKEELPADIYASAHHGTPSERLRVNRWLAEHGYRIITHPDGVAQIFRGTKLVRQTKMVLELTDPEELLGIAEVVKEHANIPPPPWNPKQ